MQDRDIYPEKGHTVIPPPPLLGVPAEGSSCDSPQSSIGVPCVGDTEPRPSSALFMPFLDRIILSDALAPLLLLGAKISEALWH